MALSLLLTDCPVLDHYSCQCSESPQNGSGRLLLTVPKGQGRFGEQDSSKNVTKRWPKEILGALEICLVRAHGSRGGHHGRDQPKIARATGAHFSMTVSLGLTQLQASRCLSATLGREPQPGIQAESASMK